MAEQTLDIAIRQGSTFEWLILVTDVDGLPLNMDFPVVEGSNAGARGQIKKKYTDAVPIITFDISIINSGGVLDAVANGTCHITLAEVAALEPIGSGKCYLLVRIDAENSVTNNALETPAIKAATYVYDIEVEDHTGFVFKPYVGSAVVGPQATA